MIIKQMPMNSPGSKPAHKQRADRYAGDRTVDHRRDAGAGCDRSDDAGRYAMTAGRERWRKSRAASLWAAWSSRSRWFPPPTSPWMPAKKIDAKIETCARPAGDPSDEVVRKNARGGSEMPALLHQRSGQHEERDCHHRKRIEAGEHPLDHEFRGEQVRMPKHDQRADRQREDDRDADDQGAEERHDEKEKGSSWRLSGPRSSRMARTNRTTDQRMDEGRRTAGSPL